MNKQPGSTFSTTINGYRSYYLTVKRLAFLSIETILTRTIDISNNALIWFRTSFKNVNPLDRSQRKGICLISKRNIARLAHRRTSRTLIITSAKRLKSLFVQAKFTDSFVLGQYTSPMKLIVLLSYPQSKVNALHIVIAPNYFFLICNVISVPVEMVIFAMVKFENTGENKLNFG